MRFAPRLANKTRPFRAGSGIIGFLLSYIAGVVYLTHLSMKSYTWLLIAIAVIIGVSFVTPLINEYILGRII